MPPRSIELPFADALSFCANYFDTTENIDIIKIAGDASLRSYYRITCHNQKKTEQNSLILAFAPPPFENIIPFINVANILQSNQLPAPKIFATDQVNGFMLLEDFGNFTITKFLHNLTEQNRDNSYRETEKALYINSCNLLLEILKIDTLKLRINQYDNKEILREALLFVEYYLPYKNHNQNEVLQDYQDNWQNIANYLPNNSLVLRDFHADNLMVMPNLKLGLLDFQDALIGGSAYDLVSLLEDARREISLELQQQVMQHFLERYNGNKEEFLEQYQIYSLQRNLKILGIFCRLAVRDGKESYLSYLPRVEQLVRRRCLEKSYFSNADLHSSFKDLCKIVLRFLGD